MIGSHNTNNYSAIPILRRAKVQDAKLLQDGGGGLNMMLFWFALEARQLINATIQDVSKTEFNNLHFLLHLQRFSIGFVAEYNDSHSKKHILTNCLDFKTCEGRSSSAKLLDECEMIRTHELYNLINIKCYTNDEMSTFLFSSTVVVNG